jgi:hypothetical protein
MNEEMKQSAETSAGKNTGEPPGGASLSQPPHRRRFSENARRFLVDVLVPVLGSAAGLVASVGALAYVLGLLALWIPINRTYTNDLDTAWYVTSLIPNTMVAGIGAGKLLAMASVHPILFLTAFVGLLAAVSYAYRHWGFRGMVITLNALVILGMLIVMVPTFLSRRAVTPDYLVPLAATSICLGMLNVLMFVGKGHGRIEKFLSNLLQSKIIWAFTCFYGLLFYVISVMTVMSQPPPLPPVSITGASDASGTLLTHTDGFWYVFHREGNEERWHLVAIPDDEVDIVRVSPER